MDRIYSVQSSGFEICEVKLCYDEYKTDRTREKVIKAIAATYNEPPSYFKLVSKDKIEIDDVYLLAQEYLKSFTPVDHENRAEKN